MSAATEKQMQLYDRLKTLITSFCQEQDVTLIEVSGILSVLTQEVNDTICRIDYESAEDEEESEEQGSAV